MHELDGVLHGQDMTRARVVHAVEHARQRGGLAAAGGARHQHQAPVQVGQAHDGLGDVHLVGIGQPEGDDADDGAALTRPEVAGWNQLGNKGFVDGQVSDVRATGSAARVFDGKVANAIAYGLAVALRRKNHERKLRNDMNDVLGDGDGKDPSASPAVMPAGMEA